MSESLKLLALFCLLNLKEVCCTIEDPPELTKNVGKKALFQWNSTLNDILDASFGLCNDGANTIATNFVSVELELSGDIKVSYNYGYLNSSLYHGRFQYFGDILKGNAWFVIENLQINDTADYCSKIKEGPKLSPKADVYRKVKLNVHPLPKITPTPTSSITAPTSTITVPGGNGTVPRRKKPQDETPTGDTEELSGGAIAGISIAVVVVVGVVIVVVVIYVKKSSKRQLPP